MERFTPEQTRTPRHGVHGLCSAQRVLRAGKDKSGGSESNWESGEVKRNRTAQAVKEMGSRSPEDGLFWEDLGRGNDGCSGNGAVSGKDRLEFLNIGTVRQKGTKMR